VWIDQHRALVGGGVGGRDREKPFDPECSAAGRPARGDYPGLTGTRAPIEGPQLMTVYALDVVSHMLPSVKASAIQVSNAE